MQRHLLLIGNLHYRKENNPPNLSIGQVINLDHWLNGLPLSQDGIEGISPSVHNDKTGHTRALIGLWPEKVAPGDDTFHVTEDISMIINEIGES